MTITPTSLVIDNSATDTYTACRRAFRYAHVDERELDKERSPLHYGRQAHLCLAAKYREQDGQCAAYPPPDYAPLVRESFAANPVGEGDFRTLDSLLGLMSYYDATYPSEDFTVARDDAGTPLVEVPFKLVLGTIGARTVFWSGRLDLIIIRNGELLLIDHKTSSRLGESYFSEYFNNQQLHGYCWAVRSLGLPIRGYIMNVLVSRKPARTGTAFELARQHYSIDNETIDIWRTNMLDILADLLRDYDRNVFPMSTKHCVHKYGKCEFFDVCTAAPGSQQMILSSGLFRPRTWSPLNPD